MVNNNRNGNGQFNNIIKVMMCYLELFAAAQNSRLQLKDIILNLTHLSMAMMNGESSVFLHVNTSFN